MLRIVFSIMVLMLCSFVLADSHHVAKNTIPASVSSIVELDSGFPEAPELVLTFTKLLNTLAPIYFLKGRVLALKSHRVTQRVYGNTSIRSPPLTF